MIVHNRNTGKQRKIKVSDIYTSDNLARIGDMINPEEIIVTILDEKTKLQDRPYLDVEVVEIKTKKKKEIPKVCVECGLKNICRQYKREYKKLEKPGTWVNGENLDKIKFPCACTYTLDGKERQPGILTSGIPKLEYEYILHSIGYQSDCSAEDRSNSLIDLMKKFDIKIEKAKTVLFREKE